MEVHSWAFSMSVSAQVMAWYLFQRGSKPLPEPVLNKFCEAETPQANYNDIVTQRVNWHLIWSTILDIQSFCAAVLSKKIRPG